MNDDDSISGPRPPSLTDGDLAMFSRIEQELFGATSYVRRQIGRYTIESRLGVGGMGVVYLAHDSRLDRPVALKLIARKLISDQAKDRLMREARVLAKLSHPNVVQVYDVGDHEGEVYIAMEFVEGQNLAQWQRSHHRWREIVEVYRAAGAGLAAAHAASIVHCDFKPANVLLGTNGQIKVADFGLAREGADDASTERIALVTDDSSSIRVIGTRGYVAPEMWQGVEPSPSSDQFAFCVSLWEALAGRRPYSDTRELVGPFAGTRSGPIWLGRALARGLQADPKQRWESLDALVHELGARPRRRRLTLLSLGATAAFIAALSRPGQSPDCMTDPALAVWTPAHAAELRARMVSAEMPGSEMSAKLIIDEFDDQQTRWNAARGELCQAHHFEGTLSASGLDLGQSCLDRARLRASLIRDAMLESNTLEFEDAEALMHELIDPRECLDEAQTGQPRGLVATLAVWTRERELGDLRVAVARGDYERALDLSQNPAPEDPRGPELLILRGRVLAQMGRRVDGHAILREANSQATIQGDLGLAFEAQLELAELSARDFENTLDARSWLSQAKTTWKLLAEPARLSADLEFTEALVLEAEGRPVEAVASLHGTIAKLEALGATERDVDRVRLRLANASAAMDDQNQAIAIYEDLLARREAELGATHPAVGILAFDLGDSLAKVRQWSAARPLLERALAIETAAYGEGSVRVASVATRLAEVEVELGQHARAQELAQSAWAVQERELARGDTDYGSALFVLVWAHVQDGKWDQAYADYAEILTHIELDHEGEAIVHQSMAWLLCRQQRCGDAEPHIELALESEAQVVQLRADLVAAEALLARGQSDFAAAQVERVLAELPGLAAEDREPTLEVEAWAILGLALAESGDVEGATRNLLNAIAGKSHLVIDLRERSRLCLARLSEHLR